MIPASRYLVAIQPRREPGTGLVAVFIFSSSLATTVALTGFLARQQPQFRSQEPEPEDYSTRLLLASPTGNMLTARTAAATVPEVPLRFLTLVAPLTPAGQVPQVTFGLSHPPVQDPLAPAGGLLGGGR
ncbi:hypothetical protein SCUP515_09148 [Seiridium cupressi]